MCPHIRQSYRPSVRPSFHLPAQLLSVNSSVIPSAVSLLHLLVHPFCQTSVRLLVQPSIRQSVRQTDCPSRFTAYYLGRRVLQRGKGLVFFQLIHERGSKMKTTYVTTSPKAERKLNVKANRRSEEPTDSRGSRRD